MAVRLIHPGEHLAEELKELGMSAAELARNLGVPTNRIPPSCTASARSLATPRCAWRTSSAPAQFWLNLQSIYELRLAHSRFGKSVGRLPTLKHPVRIPA